MRKRETYRAGQIETSRLDTDGDGELGATRRHDEIGEIVPEG